MIGRRSSRKVDEEVVKPRSFDDFDLRLGDMMRGERATLGKSLLDVQRELRIKAAYIAAIENSDPSAFDTPGFIAGYVRSYARYLGMDPDQAFEAFCTESGFSVAHGMSAEASVVKKNNAEPKSARTGLDADPFARPGTPFAPTQDAMWSQIEPRAIGSSLVLLMLICGLGYGAWSVLREVQQVQVTPVDQTPVVLSDLDPLAGASRVAEGAAEQGFATPSAEALDRLYRPQALDVPVLVARDAPISTLDPRTVGTFRPPELPDVQPTLAARPDDPVPQVVEEAAPGLRMVAVRPAWVRVRAADGTIIFEATMNGGQTYDIPATEEPPTLRVGESGSIYFQVNGQHYGPVGPRGTVTSNVALSGAQITERFEVADITQDGDLSRLVAEAQADTPQD
ncbi:helix-turn-helix domain-containing protein [Thalassococcus sp. S3]|uniref:helix-turn-helix domain-containing protein n=1 Tax=Thalassococcus sp. S3 TaxID=2017482 RepID=UPI0010247F9D|nr:helix-turn-helix domain-containing protein [Thalassococcus sp. S3]QBF31450.1 helix-turn-helix domain-containing protein [Thalassococcus sp. S3]